MIQVWRYDKNKVFMESIIVDEIGENMTTVPLLVGYVKPTFDDIEWVEGATEEEIKAWEEANKPKPPEPSKTDILEGEVVRLEKEKQILAQNLYDLTSIVEVMITSAGGTK